MFCFNVKSRTDKKRCMKKNKKKKEREKVSN